MKIALINLGEVLQQTSLAIAISMLVLASCGCKGGESGSKKISSGQAIGIARDLVEKDVSLSEATAFEISVEKTDGEWTVSIADLPAKYPGDHTLIVLDEFGNIVRVVPGR